MSELEGQRIRKPPSNRTVNKIHAARYNAAADWWVTACGHIIEGEERLEVIEGTEVTCGHCEARRYRGKAKRKPTRAPVAARERCQGVAVRTRGGSGTRRGEPCRIFARPGTGYCWNHREQAA